MSVYNIVFQSNSIDGWFSAFLAGQIAPKSEDDLVFFHPIDARNPDTWPSVEKLAPITVARKSSEPLTSLARQEVYSDKAYCFFIDCIPNINGEVCSEYFVDIRKNFNMVVIDNNPIAQKITSSECLLTAHDPEKTTIDLVWSHFGYEFGLVPEWVCQINRIELMLMRGDDSAVRENLLEICRLPTTGRIELAMQKTTEYLATYEDEKKAEAFIAEGKEKLKTKIAGFAPLLAKTHCVTLTAVKCGTWGFPMTWIGKTILYVNSTGFAPDSSELATHAFYKFNESKPDCFINFRMRTHPGGEVFFVYSARVAPTSDFNLVEYGSPFKGFEKSAGAVISALEFNLPFRGVF
jgi:hypothetical protein